MRFVVCYSLAAGLFSAEVKTITDAKNPYGLVVGPDGGLYICEIDAHQVTRLDLKSGAKTKVGEFQQPYEIRFDKARNIFVDDMPSHVVQRIDAVTKTLTTVAGTGDRGFGGDGGPAVEAIFNQPHSIAFDRAGGLLICDIGNNRIRRLDLPSGVLTTYAGNGEKQPTPDGVDVHAVPLNGPRAIGFDSSGNMYIVLREGNAVYKVDSSTNKIARFAGTGDKGFSGDGGPALSAKFNGPKGIACAPDGSVYIADTENHAIRRVDANGTITTVLGTGVRGDGPDGDPLKCKLSRPHGIFVGTDGAVYVGDSESNKVRVLR
jgi:streptogramin lyase